MARQYVLPKLASRGDEPCIDSDDRLPVGLRSTARGLVGSPANELLELGGYADAGAIERELGAEQMQFVEAEVEHPLALHVDGLAQDVRGDEWIAVAIAADPASHAHAGRKLGVTPGW